MEIIQSNKLRLFMSLCKTKNLSQTMIETHVQEELLYFTLNQLESDLEVKLFEINGNNITLTEDAILLETRLSPLYQKLLELEAFFD